MRTEPLANEILLRLKIVQKLTSFYETSKCDLEMDKNVSRSSLFLSCSCSHQQTTQTRNGITARRVPNVFKTLTKKKRMDGWIDR